MTTEAKIEKYGYIQPVEADQWDAMDNIEKTALIDVAEQSLFMRAREEGYEVMADRLVDVQLTREMFPQVYIDSETGEVTELPIMTAIRVEAYVFRKPS